MVERDPAMTGRRTIKFKIRSRLSSQTVNDNHQKKTVVELKQSNSSTTGRRQATCVMAIVLGGLGASTQYYSVRMHRSEVGILDRTPEHTAWSANMMGLINHSKPMFKKTGFLFLLVVNPLPPLTIAWGDMAGNKWTVGPTDRVISGGTISKEWTTS